jgi:hypothetical protein
MMEGVNLTKIYWKHFCKCYNVPQYHNSCRVAQVVKHLPSKSEVQSSILGTAKKKKKFFLFLWRMSLEFLWGFHWVCRSLSVICHFHKIKSADPLTWEVFSSSAFYSFYYLSSPWWVLFLGILFIYLFWRLLVNGIAFLISLSACTLLVDRKATDSVCLFCILLLCWKYFQIRDVFFWWHL